MRITKKIEKEIQAVMDDYWGSYLRGDLQTWASYLPDDYRNIGTTKAEIWNSKKEMVEFTEMVLDQMVGMAESRNKKTQIIPYDPYVMVHELGDLYVKAEEGWIFYAQIRLSSLLEKTPDGWKVLHQHGSYPDSKAEEGETFAFDELKAENKKLRDAIQRRTIELERKNRELEIEAAVERVRAEAMAMQSTADFEKVTKQLLKQVNNLELHGFTGASIYLIDENEFITCYDFSSFGNMGDAKNQFLRYDANKFPQLGRYPLSQWKKGEPYFELDFDFEKLQAATKEFEEVNVNVADSLKEALASGHLTHQWDACGRLSNGLLAFDMVKPPDDDVRNITVKMTQAFEQAYIRFLDLQKAEAQAREAQIEAALERVRSRTMAMHKSDELLETGALLFKELSKLGVKIFNCGYVLMDDKKNVGWNYGVNPGDGTIRPLPTGIPQTGTKVLDDITESWKKQEPCLIIELGPQETIAHQTYMAENLLNFSLTKEQLLALSPELLVIYTFNFKHGYLLMVGGAKLTADQEEMFMRFARVFEQTYIRFLDLQKAEAQAREAQIEAALEKVRSRSLAVNKVDEFNEVVRVVFEKLSELDIPANTVTILVNKADTQDFDVFGSAVGETGLMTVKFELPYFNTPMMDDIRQVRSTSEAGYYSKVYSQEEKNHYYEFAFKNTELKNLPDDLKQQVWQSKAYAISAAYAKNSMLGVNDFEGNVLSEDQADIIKRFSRVFEQAYIRFLDLQRAEAQAREAQIEAALERVRSKTMGMQRSEQLGETASLLFKQFADLGINVWSSGFQIWNADNISSTAWMSSAGGEIQSGLRLPHTEDPYFINIYKARHNPDRFFVMESKGKELEETYRYMFNIPEWKKAFGDIESAGFPIPKYQITHSVYFPHGYLMLITHESYPEYWDIFKRFGKVFEQTYTRFLDLKKAEAQAREAQIEAALEKVRSAMMAMHQSDLLRQVVAMMFEQFQTLGFDSSATMLSVYNEDLSSEQWMVGFSHDELPKSYHVPFCEHPYFTEEVAAWQKGTPFHELIFEGLQKVEYATWMIKKSDYQYLPTEFHQEMLSPERIYISNAHTKYGLVELMGSEPLSQDSKSTLIRFAKVFEQTYTRFLDLQRAEAQTREAQINLAVERVRARALAMFKSEEILEVVFKLKEEIMGLDIPGVAAATILLKNENGMYRNWDLTSMEQEVESMHLPLDITFDLEETHPDFYLRKVWSNGKKYTVVIQDLKSLQITTSWLRDNNKIKEADEADHFIKTTGIQQVFHPTIPLNNGRMCIDLVEAPSNEIESILLKMGSAFDLAYKRFEDLQKAEAQAREAQIEAALERTRTQSMLMQHSDELNKVSNVFHEQLLLLGLPSEFSYVWLPDEASMTHMFWATWSENNNGTLFSRSKAITNPLDKTEPYTAACYEMWESEQSVFVNHIKPEEVEDFFTAWSELLSEAENMKAEQFPDGLYYVEAYMKYGCFGINIRRPLSEEEQQVLHRFSIEFERAYTRFLDLKKAEAQTREAQIEAALERVRSRSLAMHKTDELQEVVHVVAQELKNTGVILDTWGAVICTYFQDSKDVLHWTAAEDPANPSIAFLLPYFKDELYDEAWASKNRGDSYFAKVFSYEVKNSFFNHAFEHSDYRQLPDDYKKTILESESHGIAWAWAKNSAIMIPSIQGDLPSDEEKEILIRFAKVFEQSFIRFLDIQKAEAQVREAQIEAALERIRSQATSMQRSTDLLDVVVTMRNEFIRLGHEAHYFWHMLWSPDKYEKAMTAGDGTRIGFVMELPRHIHGNIPLLAEWEKSDAPTAVYPMDVDAALDYVHKMISLGDFKNIDPNAPSDDDIRHIGGLTFIMARTTHGEIGYSLPGEVPNPPAEDLDILVRFAGAFDLAHRRFLDLQQSEALARETQIELALEKVRNRTMAMQHSDELPEAANHLFLEIQALGLPAASAGYCIWENEDKKSATAFVSSIGELQKPFSLPTKGIGYDFYNPMLNGEKFLVQELHGQRECAKHYAFMRTLPVFGEVLDGLFEAGFQIPDFQVFHIVYFSQGYLMFITREPVPHAYDIFKRCGNVFEQTYTRFLDLQTKEEQALKLAEEKQRLEKALHDLQSTQKQLIQSEKMASLGELTAGIAHEIQNPLNFVNNFSEVSSELIDEMKEEMESGDMEEVKAIANDIQQNLERILHHGKRADAIVKGMLQHSRQSSYEKAPTDINKLADEYLRLAYHGLRARDKSFNAILETDFDPTLEKIMVVPQDIGRVILNIVTNAFYAVHQKKKDHANGYQPVVAIQTQMENGQVRIVVKDNGDGIPQHIINKIFQPFFTTKPTGEGTGLGLSLCYDIVKAHDGKLEVETKEGDHTIFKITLPR